KYPALDGSLITNIAATNLTFPIDRTVSATDPNAALKLTLDNASTGSAFAAVVNNNLGKAFTVSVPGAGHSENAVAIDYNGVGTALSITSGNAGNSGYALVVDYAGSGNGIAAFANGGGSAFYGEVNGAGNGMNIKVESNNGKGIFVNVQNTNHNESAVNIDYQGQGSALNVLIGDNLANTGMGAIIDDYRAAGVGLAVLKNSAPESLLNTSLFVSNGLQSSNSIALQVGRGSTILSYETTANADLTNLGYASVIHYTGVANITLLPGSANNGQILVISVANAVSVAGVPVGAGESIMLVYSGGAWRPVV
ncbi:MAG: hypothetical protein K8F30_13855, partial [Taibaiella sp.]|nr:hypothetical protein [Taibaiella sp.]